MVTGDDLEWLQETIHWLPQPGMREDLDQTRRDIVALNTNSGADIRREFGLPPRRPTGIHRPCAVERRDHRPRGALLEDPHRLSKPLTNERLGLRAARRGDYRVLFTPDIEEHILYVQRVEHRSDVYEWKVGRVFATGQKGLSCPRLLKRRRALLTCQNRNKLHRPREGPNNALRAFPWS